MEVIIFALGVIVGFAFINMRKLHNQPKEELNKLNQKSRENGKD